MAAVTRLLRTDEAARRLGVKPATLYAYVSRGLLESHRSADGRHSVFALDDVERLARRARGGRRVETRLATVTTSVTELRVNGPAYRGVPAVELAASASFEEVAERLWGGDPAAGVPARWEGGPPASPPPYPGGSPPGAVPGGLGRGDRLRWAVLMAGAGDPLRADPAPDAVRRAARRTISAMVGSLADVEAPGPDLELAGGRRLGDPVAGRLAAALCRDPSAAVVAAVNAVLVLLADHELASSTVAVRIAASTRADLYDGVLAGLATLAGPLHGGAGEPAYRLLADLGTAGPGALNETLRWRGRLPGFDPTVYEGVDPRFPVLRGFFESIATPAQRQALDTAVEVAAAHGADPPNVDLGLAAVAWAAGMPVDAVRVLFAVARTAGWTAHYLEELAETPLRFRPRAVYAAG